MTDRRMKFRKGLHDVYLPVYDSLCQLLGPYWAPYYGVRTIAEQDALYAHGRTAPGLIVTYAKGGFSPHNYGCATDWTIWDVGGNPIWMKPSDPRWKYADACEKVGAEWGGDFEFRDCPHNELKLSCGWKKVGLEFAKGGLEHAFEFIQAKA
jgi:hypothetical protein